MRRCWFFAILIFLPLPVSGWNYEKIPHQTAAGETHLIHFFKIDPKEFRMDLLLAEDYGASAMTAAAYRRRCGAGLVINGGFFDEAYRSLGLLLRKGIVLNPVRQADWGIFQIRGGIPSILHRRQWMGEGVETAIQVGPRLVVDGKVPSLKATLPERRSALGVTAAGEIVVALSEAPLELKDWAALLRARALSALNLDGGGSSQISVSVNGFSLEVPGETGIPNAVAFFPR